MSLYKEFIYVLTHNPTGKKYVGRSKQPKCRLKSHMNSLLRGNHPNKAMQADFNSFGGEYTFELVGVEIPYRFRAENCESEEHRWMKKLKTYDERFGYNDKDSGMAHTRLENGLPAMIWKGYGCTRRQELVIPKRQTCDDTPTAK